eukprot:TRINITY_DN2044_c0_g1_i1.p2 TRINITY_DN2044_c0_g1~~TRINITY_DN2044_c0_g1_i1.p2  ORF type:complete len:96 (+),score=3.71 TRINITY_DN2044_c0_g1_i1:228-515(+)
MNTDPLALVTFYIVHKVVLCVPPKRNLSRVLKTRHFSIQRSFTKDPSRFGDRKKDVHSLRFHGVHCFDLSIILRKSHVLCVDTAARLRLPRHTRG